MTGQRLPDIPTTRSDAAFGWNHAAVYEKVYRNRGKDWLREAQDVARIALEINPAARSVLDVACGTGAHLAEFATSFDEAHGFDASDAMLSYAAKRLPSSVKTSVGDMRTFDAGRQYDVVTCLFTSAAFLPSARDLKQAVRQMGSHLGPGGVLVLEPWYFPDSFIDGYVGADLVRDEDSAVSRVSRSVLKHGATYLYSHWAVADRSGISSFDQVEVMMLFSEADYVDAFSEAGCTVDFRPGWLTGRGLFVGVRS